MRVSAKMADDGRTIVTVKARCTTQEQLQWLIETLRSMLPLLEGKTAPSRALTFWQVATTETDAA